MENDFLDRSSGTRGFFSCCLRRKLSGEAAIVTIVTIAASPLSFHHKQQEKNPLASRLFKAILDTSFMPSRLLFGEWG